ncbi:hypothetical protein FM037_16395 [Shewanella psychropiezotolerans]|uniref:DarT domain-containing protein n=1 Tax=Shewanella psychropiezotolerans TaxID=2593655 RepID=A0ABX5WZI2_9GAMM|nr:hypothetical protein [Shewanella psychropiezotolerans]QDO84495.1 hypothetical protein FM037_16395 [Shewanella psychropiezotolerans]
MREDMSDFLIHFTKGEDIEAAYQNLRSIIDQSVVYGSNAKIRDGSNCVCFSEAPISSLKSGLLNPFFYSPYSPFGIITTKEHIYGQGGRPVIYQSEAEFHHLSFGNSWRHMCYEPPAVDFTWEREWRVKTDGYHFHPGNTQIIVPDDSWAQRLIEEHDAEQQWQTLQYSQIMDELLAMQYEEPFPWVVIELENT